MLEDQIRSRRALWLINVQDYLITKSYYSYNAESFVEIRKATTDRLGHITYTSPWVKHKEWYPLEYTAIADGK